MTIAVALADLSVFSKFGVTGPDTRAFIDSLGANTPPIREDNLMENARTVGAALFERFERLRDLLSRHEAIGDVRGRGLMLAIEMVKDRQIKEPDPETTAAVFEATRENGVICRIPGLFGPVFGWCRRCACR